MQQMQIEQSREGMLMERIALTQLRANNVLNVRQVFDLWPHVFLIWPKVRPILQSPTQSALWKYQS